MTFATWITLTRLLGIPFLLYGLHQPTVESQWFSCAIFLIAASTDWLDGYVARRFNQVTDLGKFLDPLVDKLLVITPLLSLLALGQVPVIGVFLIIARELTVAGWRVNQASISGANLWGKLKTVTQILAIALLIAPLPANGHNLGMALFWVAVGLTLISGWIYLWPSQSAPQTSRSQPSPTPEPIAFQSELETTRQRLALLQNSYDFKSGFLSRVSHELRSPLNGIIGAHQLILSDLCDSPAEEREFLEHANQSTLNLLSMLDTVLKVAKVEAGKTPLTLKAFSTLDLLQDVRDLTSLQAADRTIPLHVTLPEQDWQILGDEPYLRQILLNVVSNFMQAILATPRASGEIQLSATPLPERRQIHIWVAAQVPFPAWSEPIDTLAHLQSQEPSPQLDTTPKTLSPELKLWLDDLILQQMNSSVDYFEPEPGWTRIQFLIPLADSSI